MTDNRIEIGIDVGWSLTSRSCGVAIRGIDPQWGNSCIQYCDSIRVKLFTLRELTQWLSHLLDLLNGRLRQTTVIIDGPLGMADPPNANRYIDAACRRGLFYGRAFPNDVTGNAGREFVTATYEIAGHFLCPQLDAGYRWLGQCQQNGLVVAETHPTVGLALLLPPQEVNTLPSRNRPLALNDGTLVRAKSDCYWLIGAGDIVGNILGCSDVKNEQHHERRAALYCLAVAASSGGGGQAMTIGNPGPSDMDGGAPGVYVFPSRTDPAWIEAVHQVGLVCGQTLSTGDGNVNPPGTSPFVCLPDPEEPRYGQQILHIRDNGGVWEQHNLWLEDCNSPLQVSALDAPDGQITLKRCGGNNGQWTSEPTTLALARQRGFEGEHLDNEHAIEIPVTPLPPNQLQDLQ